MLLPELESFRPSLVIARGQVVARDGRVTVPIPSVELPAEVFPGPRMFHRLALNDLRIPAPTGRDRVRVRIIHFAGEIVTQPFVRELSVRGGALPADPEADLLKVVAIDRPAGRGRSPGASSPDTGCVAVRWPQASASTPPI